MDLITLALAKSYTNKKVTEAISEVTQFDYQVVNELPASGEKGTVYLLLSTVGESQKYSEYLWIDDDWEKLGTEVVINFADGRKLGMAAPTVETVADFVGQLYFDSSNEDTYISTEIDSENEIYGWKKLCDTPEMQHYVDEKIEPFNDIKQITRPADSQDILIAGIDSPYTNIADIVVGKTKRVRNILSSPLTEADEVEYVETMDSDSNFQPTLELTYHQGEGEEYIDITEFYDGAINMYKTQIQYRNFGSSSSSTKNFYSCSKIEEYNPQLTYQSSSYIKEETNGDIKLVIFCGSLSNDVTIGQVENIKILSDSYCKIFLDKSEEINELAAERFDSSKLGTYSEYNPKGILKISGNCQLNIAKDSIPVYSCATGMTPIISKENNVSTFEGNIDCISVPISWTYKHGSTSEDYKLETSILHKADNSNLAKFYILNLSFRIYGYEVVGGQWGNKTNFYLFSGEHTQNFLVYFEHCSCHSRINLVDTYNAAIKYGTGRDDSTKYFVPNPSIQIWSCVFPKCLIGSNKLSYSFQGGNYRPDCVAGLVINNCDCIDYYVYLGAISGSISGVYSGGNVRCNGTITVYYTPYNILQAENDCGGYLGCSYGLASSYTGYENTSSQPVKLFNCKDLSLSTNFPSKIENCTNISYNFYTYSGSVNLGTGFCSVMTNSTFKSFYNGMGGLHTRNCKVLNETNSGSSSVPTMESLVGNKITYYDLSGMEIIRSYDCYNNNPGGDYTVSYSYNNILQLNRTSGGYYIHGNYEIEVGDTVIIPDKTEKKVVGFSVKPPAKAETFYIRGTNGGASKIYNNGASSNTSLQFRSDYYETQLYRIKAGTDEYGNDYYKVLAGSNNYRYLYLSYSDDSDSYGTFRKIFLANYSNISPNGTWYFVEIDGYIYMVNRYGYSGDGSFTINDLQGAYILNTQGSSNGSMVLCRPLNETSGYGLSYFQSLYNGNINTVENPDYLDDLRFQVDDYSDLSDYTSYQNSHIYKRIMPKTPATTDYVDQKIQELLDSINT